MRRRQESVTELLFRYRGIIIVVSIPILLIFIVVTCMPRSMPVEYDADADVDSLDRLPQTGGSKLSAAESAAGGERYAVIIDAGSTGSRIHVYKFDSKLELQEINGDLELFVAIKPGLSSYKDDPKKGADSLRELIDKALAVVPETVRPSTPIRVGATAGLRLLPGNLADQILEEVRTMLNEYPFTFKADSVKILDGADEGSFAWVTVNYLLGKLGQQIGSTVGVVDLGGGSVQMTYAVSDDVAKKAPEGYIRPLNGMGQTYNVYVHSYLGFGLMAGRAEVLKVAEGEEHACLLKGVDHTYTYGSDQFKAKAPTDGSDVAKCQATVAKALKLTESCSFDACSFGGIWSGGSGDGVRNIYVASYFFDRAGQVGVIPDAKVPSVTVKPAAFEERAKAVCSTPLEEIPKAFPLVKEDDAPYICLDVVYQHALLSKGFGVDQDKEVTLVKQVTYKGKDVEAAWPLGAAIDALA